MKKLFRLIVLLLVVAAAAIFFMMSNMDGIAKRVIERAGTETMGTTVSVGAVSLDLPNGSAVLYDFRVANPPGFSDQSLLRFDELRLEIDVRSLNQDVIRIRRITSRNPALLYELQDGRANLDVVREHLAARQPTAPVPPEPGFEVVLSIDEVHIEDIQGSLLSDELPRQVNVNLGDVLLQNMEGTPEEIAVQIARPLFDQVSRHAGAALLRAATDVLEAELTERAGEALDGLRDRLGDRLRRN